MEIIPNNSLLNLAGKTAIVTGGARGIGFGIVFRLAEAGANVIIADLRKELTEKAESQITAAGHHAAGVVTDVAKEEDVVSLVNEAVNRYGGVDILINNAGIFPSMLVQQMTLADFYKVIAVNLKGPFLCTKYVAAQMIKQGRGGRIINITSIDALHPSTIGLAHYDASKHGLWGFTKNVALELATHKIWVNAVAPGGIQTPGVAEMQGKMKVPEGVDMTKMMEAFMAKIPMHRLGEPDEIGKVVLFLASDMASYMTGSQIVVDGGALLS